MIEKVSMTQATPFDRLQLAIIGPEKGGKSRLAATGRKGVLFADTDGRRASLAGIKDVYAATLTDKGGYMMPTAFSELIDLVVELEKSRKLTDLGFTPSSGGATEVKTFVFDSIQTVAKAAMAYALYNNKDLRRDISIGGKMNISMSRSYDGWGAEMGMVEQLVTRTLAIPDLDVIIILHETLEEAADSTEEKPRYTGKIGIYPPRYKRLLKYFNEVWRVTRDQNIPRVQVIADYSFTAATNLNLDANSVDKPDIAYLINKALATQAK